MSNPFEEKLNILKNEYLPLIINLTDENKPTFEEYLNHRVSPIVGKMIFNNGNWYLLTIRNKEV